MTRKEVPIDKVAAEESHQLTCGLIMPISAIEGCSAEHWLEVKSIVVDSVESISDYDFSVKLVSDQDDAGVIQKRIVQNVYNSDIVICDVSCKNPNVMFELGMRLAFDKPTIIIKDDATDYSFDTGVIEHLNYPRDLRFAKMVAFKKSLADKVSATYKAFQADASHSFLSSFGTFKVAALKQTEGTPDQVMLDMLSDISREVSRLRKNVNPFVNANSVKSPDKMASVSKAVNDFKLNNPSVNLLERLGDESFYRNLEALLPPTHSFTTRHDLVDSIDSYVYAFESQGSPRTA